MKTGYEGDRAQVPEQRLPVQLDLLERDTELTAVTGLIAASPAAGGCSRSRGRGCLRPKVVRTPPRPFAR